VDQAAVAEEDQHAWSTLVALWRVLALREDLGEQLLASQDEQRNRRGHQGDLGGVTQQHEAREGPHFGGVVSYSSTGSYFVLLVTE
jgi:hypothetical protein